MSKTVATVVRFWDHVRQKQTERFVRVINNPLGCLCNIEYEIENGTLNMFCPLHVGLAT